MKKEIIIGLFFVLMVLVSGCGVQKTSRVIDNFEKCIATGNMLLETYPPQCRMPEGTTFTEDHCRSGEYVLTISDAKKLAERGECGAEFKETYVCNNVTGTYWIDLDIKKKGCNPACVVDIETREVEINWRCTGANP